MAFRNLTRLLATTILVAGAGGASAQEESGVPEAAQQLYTDAVSAGTSAYGDFAAPEQPWRWCHSESYMGNPWRVTMNEELERLVQGAVGEATVSEFIVADSNGDTTQQIAQIRSFIDRDCDIITTIAGSSAALNDAIDAAYEAGIPVVTTAGAVTTPNAINVMHNQNLWGYDMGQGIAEALPEGGNILQVEGISGHPLVEQENAGLDEAVAEAEGLDVVRTVSGEWTASTTKSAVLQALATTPQQIDAVWSTGSETRVIAEAFGQAGRPMPLITGSISGDALGYWNENQDSFRFYGVAAQNAYRIGMRLLSGQKPKVATIIATMPTITQDDLPEWYQDCMQPDSAALFPIPPENPFPEDLMDAYFTGGTGTPAFDYGSVPPSCP